MHIISKDYKKSYFTMTFLRDSADTLIIDFSLAHCGKHKMADILQMIFSNTFSLMEIMYFDSNFVALCSS